MKISIITWDSNFREFTQTIDCFCGQEFPVTDFEFIWVDFCNSNQYVKKTINIYPNAYLLKLGKSLKTKWHLGKCINAGVDVSSGEILVIPDGDIMVEKDFLDYVWDTHQRYQDLVLYFRRFDEPMQYIGNQGRTSILRLQKYTKLLNPKNYSGCLTLRRFNFDKVHGYETHEVFSGPGCQGLDMYIRLCNLGLAIKWAEDKKIFHPWHPDTSSPMHSYREALKFARLKYPWILPYAGIKQSWVVHCRERSLDFVADECNCEKYLSQLPKIDMDQYIKASKWYSTDVSKFIKFMQWLKDFVRFK